MAFCMHCGAEIADGSKFCNSCGKKQTMRYNQTFRRENLSEEEFIERINAWFAQYSQVANVQAEMQLGHGVGMLVNKYVLNAVSIEYEVFKGENTNQYAMVQLSKFGLTRTDTDRLLEQWKQANPGATIVRTAGGVHQRGDTGSLMLGGVGASNKTQLYVLFKFDRKRGTAVPSAQT